MQHVAWQREDMISMKGHWTWFVLSILSIHWHRGYGPNGEHHWGAWNILTISSGLALALGLWFVRGSKRASFPRIGGNSHDPMMIMVDHGGLINPSCEARHPSFYEEGILQIPIGPFEHTSDIPRTMLLTEDFPQKPLDPKRVKKLHQALSPWRNRQARRAMWDLDKNEVCGTWTWRNQDK